MNLKNKKTVLSDDAALYSHKEDVGEKEKWQAMSKKERWQYFKDYYLMKIIAIVVTLAVVGSILHTMLTPKPEVVLSVAIVNDAANQLLYEALQTEFNEAIALDVETQQTVFDTGYNFTNGDYQSWQKFSMYNMVGDLDISILPLSLFEEYAPGGYFSPIAAHLPSDLYGALSEVLMETKQQDEKGILIPDSETVYGINLSSTWLFENQPSRESMVLVINAAPENVDNIETFLKFLFFRDDVK